MHFKLNSQSYQFQDKKFVLWEGEAVQDVGHIDCRNCHHFLKAPEREKHTQKKKNKSIPVKRWQYMHTHIYIYLKESIRKCTNTKNKLSDPTVQSCCDLRAAELSPLWSAVLPMRSTSEFQSPVAAQKHRRPFWTFWKHLELIRVDKSMIFQNMDSPVSCNGAFICNQNNNLQ